MEVKRIDSYDDPRFSSRVLRQHGCFLVDGHPCEVEITGGNRAVLRAGALTAQPQVVDALIEQFRFFAEHITVFTDETGAVLREFPAVSLFPVCLSDVQPSQFFVDEDKLRAVEEYTESGEEIVVPLLPFEGGYLSCDGHTRMYLAAQKGIWQVRGFLAEENDVVRAFAQEAQKRGVRTPMDMKPCPTTSMRSSGTSSATDSCKSWNKRKAGRKLPAFLFAKNYEKSQRFIFGFSVLPSR